MEDDTPLTAHQRLSAYAMVARLDSAVHCAMENGLADQEAWLRDSRDYLKIFIEHSKKNGAPKFITFIEPQLAEFERAVAGFVQGQ